MSNQELSIKLTGVPRTMLMTTRARVDEHQRSDRLFADPTVIEWWRSLSAGQDLTSFYDDIYSPIAQLSWANRAYIIDRIVQKHLQKYPDAIVVELGAGLSTRYYRIGQNCRSWFDLDLPEITDLRRQLDKESDRHRILTYSALDFAWMEELPAVEPEKILFIAEGLLMYFEKSEVQALGDRLRAKFPEATLVCDIVGGITKGKTNKFLNSIGAPLKWFAKNEQDLPAMGLSLVEVKSLVRENCRYPKRIGIFRWIPWIAYLPAIRNSSLILELKI
ncbi:MAG: class I SAM-dependent methyltransferase [Cyanobacteria bacterium P01_G01_bin.19]